VGREGTFIVRPEKIRLVDPEATPGPGEVSTLGRIKTVVYVGPETRYIVAVDEAAELVVVEQNLRSSSMEALAAEGRAVRLVWHRDHCLPIVDREAGGAGDPAREEELRP
jgi:putative spermidine/putrescine transport system ATP-binding protein